MATVQIFNSFKEAVAEAKHNLGTDTLKFVLANTAPSLSNTQLSDITEIANGNGYTTGGTAVTVSSSSQSGGTYSLVLAACVFTASGGTIGPFRYIVLYDDTSTNNELIGYLDYGSSYTLPSGQSFTINAGTFLTIA